MEGGERARQAMADAYAQPIPTRPETLLPRMQGYVTVAATEARGDDLTGELVRVGRMRIRETVRLSPGADAGRTASSFARDVLGNTLAAVRLPQNTGRRGSVPEGRSVSARPPRRAG